MGEDDFRDLMEESDIDGPLVDYQAKGNKVEYLGHDTVDGDDAYELKVTLKNGDIVYYYLDPDTYLEIKKKKQQFIRGSVRETEQRSWIVQTSGRRLLPVLDRSQYRRTIRATTPESRSTRSKSTFRSKIRTSKCLP